MEKKQKKLAALVALLLVFVLGGTFAYFNQTLTAENPFDTDKYETVLTEDFKPEDGKKWQPGATVNKVVAVDNTGDYPVVVRVKFDETWAGKELGNTIFEATGRDGSTGQVKDDDGLTTGDTSVVKLIFNGTDGAAENWTYNKDDGYWYYNSKIEPGKSTDAFLKAVQLIEDADMGTYNVKKYYTTAVDKPAYDKIGTDPATQWVQYEPDKDGNLNIPVPNGSTHNMAKTVQVNPGYSNADYTLKITAQTVQATKAAAEAAFGAANVLSGWNLQ